MTDKIKEALLKLDPANENHWTADGSARLETVKFNSGGDAITREEIDTMFPGFTKDTASTYKWPEASVPAASEPVAGAEPNESPREDGAGAAAQASQPGGDGAGGPTFSETELSEVESGETGSNEIEDLEAELEEVEAVLSDLRREVDDLNKSIAAGVEHADKIRVRIDEVRGSDQTDTIQSYLESRKEQLRQRAENRQTLKDSGLTLKTIAQAVSAAPIDQAMARKLARGGRRPTRV